MANTGVYVIHSIETRLRTSASLLMLLVSCFSLAQEVQPTAPDTVDKQLRLLQESERASARREAIWQLSGQPGREINEAMVKALNDRDAAVRSAAIYHLRGVRWPLPAATLQRLAQDGDSGVREAAMWAMMTLYPAQHPDTVSAALGDSAPNVRTAAIWAAGEFSQAFEPEFSSRVMKLFDQCFSKECNAIISVLLKHGDRLPISVRSRLMEKSSRVKAAAARAIGESAAYAEIGTARALAVESISWVRAAAAGALGALAGRSDDGSAEAMLLRLLGDKSPVVRRAAADALEKTGFIAPRNILDFIEDKTDDSPWIAELDRTDIAPVLMELWGKLQGAERRRLARVLMGWHYEPAVEAGLALVASRSLLDRMTGWRGLIGYWKSAYLGRGVLATFTSLYTWLYLVLVAAIVTWAIRTRNNLRTAFSKDRG